MLREAAAWLALTGFASTAVLAQERPIIGQDPATADRGSGTTGWVQAPTPRGYNAPQQPAQGAGASTTGAHLEGGQVSAGQNPGTPVANPVPGPAGTTQ